MKFHEKKHVETCDCWKRLICSMLALLCEEVLHHLHHHHLFIPLSWAAELHILGQLFSANWLSVVWITAATITDVNKGCGEPTAEQLSGWGCKQSLLRSIRLIVEKEICLQFSGRTWLAFCVQLSCGWKRQALPSLFLQSPGLLCHLFSISSHVQCCPQVQGAR